MTTKTKTFTLTEVAKKLKIDPKIARRRIRDAGLHKREEGWIFPAAKRTHVVKIVKGEA
jgi:hypothetical protein